MKHLLFALVVVGALFVMSSVASAQCYHTAYYAPVPHVSYYAPPAVYYPPAYTTYYHYRPWFGGYRYYARRPVVFYYGW